METDGLTDSQRECLRKITGILQEQFAASALVIRAYTPNPNNPAQMMLNTHIRTSGGTDVALAMFTQGQAFCAKSLGTGSMI
jgi:hypothetical protein